MDELPLSSHDRPTALDQRRRRRVVIVFSTAALVVFHLWISRDLTLPPDGPPDQWGYLGSARWLSGDPHDWILPRFPYFTYGYSLVLVPAVRLFQDPEDLFLAIRVTNAVLAAAVLPLLHLFCRQVLGSRPGPALAAAAVGALVPPLVAHSSSILAENLVLPLTVATMLACWWALTDRPGWQRVWFGPAMVLLHITHNRFALALPLMFLVLLLGARGRLLPRPLAMANGVVAAVLLIAGQVVRNRLVKARWVNGIDTPQGPASDALQVFTSGRGVAEYLLAGIGQIWYVAVGTIGLSLIGLWLLAGRAVARPSESAAGRARLLMTVEDPRRLTIAFLLAAAAAVLFTSTYFFTQVTNGSEGYIAGRHNDSFVPLWAAAGVTFLMTERSRRRLRQVTIGSIVVILTVTAALLLGRDEQDWASLYSRLNVPAVVHYASAGVDLVPTATGVAVGGLLLVLVVIVAGRRPAVLLPVVCAWLVWSASTDVPRVSAYERSTMPSQMERFDIERAAVVQPPSGGVPSYYQYFLPSLTAVPWDGSGAPPEPYVIAEVDPEGLADRGARLALVDRRAHEGLQGPRSIGLWVFPGSEAERLDDIGALLPPDFPAALPEESHAAELDVIDGVEGDVAEVESGSTVDVEIAGRHLGTGSPWPDEGSVGPRGSVRVGARLLSSSAVPRSGLVGTSRLPRWLRPGDRFVTPLRLAATDADGRPLPAGRYEVGIDLEQVGYDWFVDPGQERARLTLVVS